MKIAFYLSEIRLDSRKKAGIRFIGRVEGIRVVQRRAEGPRTPRTIAERDIGIKPEAFPQIALKARQVEAYPQSSSRLQIVEVGEPVLKRVGGKSICQAECPTPPESKERLRQGLCALHDDMFAEEQDFSPVFHKWRK